MRSTRRYISIDLGASSGRVVEVRVGADTLDVRELHRFSNANCIAIERAGRFV